MRQALCRMQGAFFGSMMLHMPKTGETVKLVLNLPEHVQAILDGWAAWELQATPEEVLEALADALCTNEELRQYVASLMRK
jgi:hypothetical protein